MSTLGDEAQSEVLRVVQPHLESQETAAQAAEVVARVRKFDDLERFSMAAVKVILSRESGQEVAERLFEDISFKKRVAEGLKEGNYAAIDVASRLV